MSTAVRLGALFVAVAAASAAIVWTGSARSSSEESKISVCVGKDRVLRLLEEGAEECATGERRLELSQWAEAKPEAPEAEEEKDATEEKQAVNRVTAPFEVVDGKGSVIFRVTDDQDGLARGAHVFRDVDSPLISLGVPDVGPWIALTEKDGATLAAVLGMNQDEPRFQLYQSGLPAVDLGSAMLGGYVSLTNRGGETPAVLMSANHGKGGQMLLFDAAGDSAIDLGPGTAGNPALRFYAGEQQHVAAAIGIDTKGQGAVRLSINNQVAADMTATAQGGGSITAYHHSGAPAAVIAGQKGAGYLQVFSESGSVLGSVTQGANGGLLQLNSMSGEPMVEAGNNGNVGVVRTGPMSRGSTAIPGLPGSYILGKR